MCKEVLFISGKGGTGKTSLTGAFSVLAGKEAVLADCDVDASDLHLLLNPDVHCTEEFYSGKEAQIQDQLCIQCGRCAEVCRFDAIATDGMTYRVNPLACEGCGYCSHVCPGGAIEMSEQKAGEVYTATSKVGSPMVYAALGIGAENSGKLVTRVRKLAKQKAHDAHLPYVLIDGAPGIACPVIASLSGVDYVVMVTEPTLSGMHDLQRLMELVKRFGVKIGCILNKAGIYPAKEQELKAYLKTEGVDLLAELPYDQDFTMAMLKAQTLVEYDPKWKEPLAKAWKTIRTHLEEDNSKLKKVEKK